MLSLRTFVSRLPLVALLTLFATSAIAAPRTVIGELWSQDN